MKGKKVLITGAPGLVGSALALELSKNNEVYGLARFTDAVMRRKLEQAGVSIFQKDVYRESLNDLPDDFDYVFSQVVMSASCDKKPSEAFDVNAYFVGRLMDHCRKASGVVLASSGSVYAPGPDPLDEDGPIGPIDTYGVSKLGGELLGRFLSQQWQIPTCILRYFFPYGLEGGRPTQWARQIARGEEIPLNRAYDPMFSPLYMSDCIRYTIESSSHCSVPARVINVGGTETVPQSDILDILSEGLGIEPMFRETDEVPRFWNADVGLMSRLFGTPEVTLREGLTRVANMLRKQD